jgi:mannose-1-phosphate guanylyltransferase/mannose-1-phosphate guanylyltransferase/mannose-6-phosphate isomerase
MFVFRAGTMAEHFRKHMPRLWEELSRLKDDESNLREVFEKLPSESIDYGVMEKLTEIRCVVADMGWSDIGSWEEVAEHSPQKARPIEVEGRANDYLPFNVTPKKTAFVGVSDIELVETGDALLVLRKGAGQKLRDVVKALQTEAPLLLEGHVFEERPWGRFEVLLDTAYFKSKKITVWAGQRLSYQSHTKRAEHWVVVKGIADVTLNDVVHRLKAGEHIHIPLGAKHRIANPGPEEMEFIEVQTGTYFGEDDIVRYSDEYGRK